MDFVKELIYELDSLIKEADRTSIIILIISISCIFIVIFIFLKVWEILIYLIVSFLH